MYQKKKKNHTKLFCKKKKKIDTERYTIYKTFKKLKEKSKKSYYLNLTDKYKNYVKKT